MTDEYYDADEVEFLDDEELELLEKAVAIRDGVDQEEDLLDHVARGASYIQEQLGRELSNKELTGLANAAFASGDPDFDVVGAYVEGVESGQIEPFDVHDDTQRVESMAEMMEEGSAGQEPVESESQV